MICYTFFWKSRQLRIRQHARAYGFIFERHQRSDFFVEKLYSMRALALASACLPARARGAARDGLAAIGVLGGSAAKWTNVVWPIKSRQTNKPTNKHTLLFYRYRSHGEDSCSPRCRIRESRDASYFWCCLLFFRSSRRRARPEDLSADAAHEAIKFQVRKQLDTSLLGTIG